MSKPEASQPEVRSSNRERERGERNDHRRERNDHRGGRDNDQRGNEQRGATQVDVPMPPPNAPAIPMHLSELKTKHVSELVEIAIGNGIENASRMRKQDFIFALLKSQAKKGV